MADIDIPHWLLVLLGSGALSIPFALFNAFQCGALNPNATAPFTLYQSVTCGLNAIAVGVYLWLANYAVWGYVLTALGIVIAVVSYGTLLAWYRRNPSYRWRLFKSLESVN